MLNSPLALDLELKNDYLINEKNIIEDKNICFFQHFPPGCTKLAVQV